MMLVQQCCLYKRIFSKFKIRAKLCISAQQYSFAEMVHGREGEPGAEVSFGEVAMEMQSLWNDFVNF